MKEKAFIHCFSTNNNYYVYDVNTNSILRINKEIYIKLNEHTDIETLLDDKIVQMREQGFLRSNNPLIKIEHPLTDTLKSQLENNVELLILQVTQNCNFRCEYCGGLCPVEYTTKKDNNGNLTVPKEWHCMMNNMPKKVQEQFNSGITFESLK